MSRAKVIAWFAEREGKKIVTVQRKPNGDEWRPGPRIAAMKGNRITLDGSRVSLDGKAAEISDGGTLVTLTWRDGVGDVIHTTTYSEPLPAYAWPGGYPMFYLMKGGDVCCAPCAEQWRDEVTGRDAHWEGEPITCDDCNKDIESAYGVPNES